MINIYIVIEIQDTEPDDSTATSMDDIADANDSWKDIDVSAVGY